MTEDLLSRFGYYGGAFAISLIAGVFPLVSIEVFMVGVATLKHPSVPMIVLMALLAAIAHQIAKTITYFAGDEAINAPKGKMRDRIERVRHRIERWNKRPILIMSIGATVGLPPMYLLGFIAKPLMNIRFWPFTVITFVGRFGRYAVMGLVPLLF